MVSGMAADTRAALWRNLRTWDGFLALGLGSGLSTFAPGTAGTLAALPLAVVLRQLPTPFFWLALLAALLLGVWVCDRVGRRLGVTDHGALVWDEFVGYWLAVALVPLHWGWLLAGFFVFRGFDILKPWPVRALERRLPGGWGVMLDDVAAGALTLAVLWAAERWLLPLLPNLA